MKPTATRADHDAFPVQKSIFEFALRARKITILRILATQFHEISVLGTARLVEITRSGESTQHLKCPNRIADALLVRGA